MSTFEGDGEELTRKQRREQARAQRKELERAEAADAMRRKRLTQLGIASAIVVVVILAIVLATSGGSKTSIPKPASKQANQVVSEVGSLLAGVPQSGNALGAPNAPVTLQYFADLECPICKEFTLLALPSLIRTDVSTGKLRIEFHAMKSATVEPATFNNQQMAALAAGKQNKLWNFIELFYHEQGAENSGYVTESYLQGLAQQVPGLSLPAWTAERSNPEYANSLVADAQTANTEGFTGTPAFLLGKTGTTLPKFEPGSFGQAGPYIAAVGKLLKK
jgi:protein-disulfide isomerase